MTCRRTAIVYAAAALIPCVMLTSAASAAELQLAGIKLGRPALSIMQKYGNPTQIRVGAAPQQSTTMPGAIFPFSGTGATPGMGIPGFPASLGTPEGFPTFGAPGSVPPALGMLTPGGPAVQQATAPEVTWVYMFPNNKTLEFIINPDGRVIQIAAFGVGWPSIRTSKGITLGHTYKDMVLRYGYPESHQQTGIELICKYLNKHRVLFTLVGKRVVGVTIALTD